MSIILWLLLHFMNPYNHGFELRAFINTLFTLFAPACFAILSVTKSKPNFMLIAFILSLPMSVYMSLTPGVFAMFGLTNLAYLISFFLLYLHNKRINVEG